MSEALTQILDVYRIDPDGAEAQRVGEVEFAPDGRLSLTDVDPDMATKLRQAILAVNGQEEIVELAPPDATAERYDLGTRVTKRTESGFFDAVNRFLARYYGFSLG